MLNDFTGADRVFTIIPIDFLAALGAFCENHAGTKLQFVGLIVDQEFNIEHAVDLPLMSSLYRLYNLHVYIALFTG